MHKLALVPDDELPRVLETAGGIDADGCYALAARFHVLANHERALDLLEEAGLLDIFDAGETELPSWITLDDFLRTNAYRDSVAEIHGHLYFRDPERAERIDAAAEHGTDGSTHAERIDDMREAWREYVDSNVLLPGNADAVFAEIDACETWHERNGTLQQTGA